MKFNDEQIKVLNAPLDPKNVKQRKQGYGNVSYVEGWHVINEANRIFGFGAWDRETSVSLVSEKPRKVGKQGKDGWSVTYTATVTITVEGVTRQGVGAGHGIDVDLGQAHESAIKEAETDAMKRAFMTFGNPFGLALYDKQQKNVGVPQDDTPQQEQPKQETPFDSQEVDWEGLAERLSLAINNAESVDAINNIWDHESAQKVLDNIGENVVASLNEARRNKIGSFKTAFPEG